jgi:hypothetical protein
VINGAPAVREGAESPLCTAARQSLEELRAPVWFGQITHRTTYSLALADGQGAREFEPESKPGSRSNACLLRSNARSRQSRANTPAPGACTAKRRSARQRLVTKKAAQHGCAASDSRG